MPDGRPYRGRLESDPWRYVCPDCGSHTVRELRSDDRPKNKTYPANGHGQRAARADWQLRYRCQNCRERKTHVIDKKGTATGIVADGGASQ